MSQESETNAQQDAFISAAFAQMDESDIFPDEQANEYDVETGLRGFRVWMDDQVSDVQTGKASRATQSSQASAVHVQNNSGTLTIEAPEPQGNIQANVMTDLMVEMLLTHEARMAHEARTSWRFMTVSRLSVLVLTAASSITVAAARQFSWPLAAVLAVINIVVGVVCILMYPVTTQSQAVAGILAAMTPTPARAPSRPRAVKSHDNSGRQSVESSAADRALVKGAFRTAGAVAALALASVFTLFPPGRIASTAIVLGVTFLAAAQFLWNGSVWVARRREVHEHKALEMLRHMNEAEATDSHRH